MERIFRDKAPEVEIRGGMAFIKPEDPPEIAITVANLRKFVARASEALAKWQVAELERVVEFPDKH